MSKVEGAMALWVGACLFLLAACGAGGASEQGAGRVRALSGRVERACLEHRDTNLGHEQAGRAYAGGIFGLYAYAVGSGDCLGLLGTQWYSPTTTLAETSDGYFEEGSCPLDGEAPGVTILSPEPGATLSGLVSVSVDATDNVGVTRVVVAVQTVHGICELTGEPYECPWDSRAIPNGNHSIEVTAFDAAGNQGQAAVEFATDNVVGITSPASGETLSGQVDLRVHTDGTVRRVVYRFSRDGGTVMACENDQPPYDCPDFDTTNLPENGSYLLRATADCEDGTQASSQDVQVDIDNSIPQVILLAPGEGATVSGTVQFLAEVTDAVGIETVWFAPIVAGDVFCETVSPEDGDVYTCLWDSHAVPDGTHLNVVAGARNIQGNAGYSYPEVHFTVDNSQACQDWTASNFEHVQQGRAYRDSRWHAVTVGGDDDLGLYNTFVVTTVRETGPGYFEAGSCP